MKNKQTIVVDNSELKRFEDERLDNDVVLVNELLMIFLNSKKEIKKLLIDHFSKCIAGHYDGGIKKFKLQGWCGNEVNPTLEIVEIKDKFKFAMTHYGALGPLTHAELSKFSRKQVIMEFFIEPLKYFKNRK